jgi:hypothetical protein
MAEPVEVSSAEPVFLTEYERGARAAVLGVVLGVMLAVLGRRR